LLVAPSSFAERVPDIESDAGAERDREDDQEIVHISWWIEILVTIHSTSVLSSSAAIKACSIVQYLIALMECPGALSVMRQLYLRFDFILHTTLAV
jgi:hypothetical protein